MTNTGAVVCILFMLVVAYVRTKVRLPLPRNLWGRAVDILAWGAIILVIVFGVRVCFPR